VGIQNPSRTDGIQRSIPLWNRAISTSGDYVQSFEQGGRRYSHTIDPRTGRPVTHVVTSVTVLHASSALADGWATALNVLGPEHGFQLTVQKGLPVLMILRTAEGFTEKMTPAFEALIPDPSSP
jgi:thiamine biosynthesis lipoprotein